MYRKKPKKQKTATAPVKTTPYPKKLIKPLTINQLALMNMGNINGKSLLLQWYERNPKLFAIAEKILFVLVILVGLFRYPYLLLLLPVAGASIYYRTRLKFIWIWLKVHILQRNFYQDRRELYAMGALSFHLKIKRPKKYENKAVIWGESGNVQEIKYRKLQKSEKLQRKEYIMSI